MFAEIDKFIMVKIVAKEHENKTLIADANIHESGANKIQIISNILVLYGPAAEWKITLP